MFNEYLEIRWIWRAIGDKNTSCEFVYNLCEFIHNLSLSKITSYNTFTTLLLGLRLSASFTWLLTKHVQLVCQTNHLSISLRSKGSLARFV